MRIDLLSFFLLDRTKGIPMGKNEKTGKGVGEIASRGMKNPSSLTNKEIRAVSASALTQRPDRKPSKRT